MAIKCFIQTSGHKVYVNSEHICCVRTCVDGVTAIDMVNTDTIYTKQRIESIVRWWREKQEEKDLDW